MANELFGQRVTDTRIQDALAKFRDFVENLRFEGDTLALDKALGEAALMLYDIRLLIDYEWAAQRVIAQVSKPKPTITRAELEAELEALFGKDLP